MNIEYTGRHTAVTPRLKAQAETAIAAITRVTHGCTGAHVILTEDKHRQLAEVSLQCRGEGLVATAEAATMETALHAALAKVEQQAIRNKEKVSTARSHPPAIPAPSL